MCNLIYVQEIFSILILRGTKEKNISLYNDGTILEN